MSDIDNPGLSKQQKTGLFLLSIFGILAIGLGYLQIRNTMLAPFALNNKVPAISQNVKNGIEALRFRDTDKDGLNDFDELYVYGTSQYLADTDSDGINDKQEVDKGTNPICPEGSSCSMASTGGTDLTTGSLTSTPSYLNATIGTPPATTSVILDLEAAVRDVKQVRKMMLDAGVDATMLGKISDADLMKVVSEVMMTSGTAVTGTVK